MQFPHLLVQDKKDNVGVVVVEGVVSGTEMLCLIIEDDADFKMAAQEDVPIGHKIALVDLSIGDDVIKCGQDIGRVVNNIKRGHHVHVHNLKTKRW